MTAPGLTGDLNFDPVEVLEGWKLISVPFGSADVNAPVVGFACYVYGVAVENISAVNPAELRFLNGRSSGSPLVLPYSLLAGPAGATVGESARDLWPLPGWPFPNGVYLNLVSGAVIGSLAIAIPA